MNKMTLGAAVLAAWCGPHAMAAESLHVTIGGTATAHALPAANASCVAVPSGALPPGAAPAGAAPGPNRSPALAWSAGPAGTRSYALTMVDLDVPADLTLIGKAGTTIARDAPRRDFVHWVLADIPQGITSLAEGADGDGQPAGGEPLTRTPHGLRGQNGFAAFLEDGPHGGYLGPCPPSNDLRVHRYRITVYALDTERLGVKGAFTRADLLAAAQGRVLASGTAEVDYAVNPAAKP
ncbi:YbhB/YbcL family Raf kinase inhibitor-like protein [Labrys wisconsinensis]|uniref:Raf kinase inhibitor-like YbhB/YbcL family protein n=1 Tax=Labrys wisconsinensis TaxID=425677 RepID=A0ABU0JL22_9HYPH|nr:YbhB/YbcL family Raf kinase inhibitor-like protein [Labrys wisconsinensis]MDQ0474978.1 Raf kinase inhibitor-like YbhB/YbcL family protein [Labrys wisconsinensis]